MNRLILYAFMVLGTLLNLPLVAQPTLILEPMVLGLSNPIEVTHAGDERLFIVEQRGTIQIVDAQGVLTNTPFLDLRDRVNSRRSEQGLLGLAFHPRYTENGYFYVHYTRSNGQSRIARFSTLEQNADVGDPTTEKVILDINQPFANHNGGSLHFGPDSLLYIALGDGGSGGDPSNFAQNPASLLGKMLRIDIDTGDPYSIPEDNPFVNQSSFAPEIWAWGLRNPWKFSFDRETGDMWIGDVGQDRREEISMTPAGSAAGVNFGWRCYEGNDAFNTNNCPAANTLQFPVFAYNHRFGDRKSVTGGYVYRGSTYPALQGYYVFGDFVSGQFWVTKQNDAQIWLTTEQAVRWGRSQIATFGEGVDGELYVAEYNGGRLFRVGADGTATSVDTELRAELQIGPNPTQDYIDITWKQVPSEAWEIRVTDVQGRSLYVAEQLQTSTHRLKRNGWAAGLYWLSIKRKHSTYSTVLSIVD